MKIFNAFVLLFLALLCVGKGSFAQFEQMDPAIPQVTNGTISWAQNSSGEWIASASEGKYTISNHYTLSGTDHSIVTNGRFRYLGGSVLSKPDPNKCGTWFYEASFTSHFTGSQFVGGIFTVDPLYGTHDYTACPTVTPTPSPTATPTPAPSLTLSLDKSQIVAGGWDDTHKAYGYTEKESGKWKPRDQKPDPHIATLTATLKDGQGNPLAGKTINFKWDMPGPAPEKTPPVVTDSEGKATVDVVSGDTLSKAFDEKDGHLLYDEPVKVEATYGDTTQSKNLDVLAPTLTWEYKNEQNDYVPWKGEVDGLYSRESKRMKIPLKVVLTFDDMPVIGHRVSWDIDGIYDKGGGPVLPSSAEYKAYGRLSGPISTSTRKGGATATFSPGYRKGQLVFAFTDASVLTQTTGASPAPMPTGEFKIAAASAHYDKKKGRYVTIPVTAYDWVGYVDSNPHFADGTPSGGKEWKGYPAPSGEEDDELLPQTLNLARRIMVASKESKTNSRYQTLRVDSGGTFTNNAVDPYLQQGAWWFSQAVGNDRESYGTHLADVKVTTKKYDPLKKKDVSVTNYYSGAFDIVITKVPIFLKVKKNPRANGRRAEFGVAVKALRDNGIVAWHRWAGESHSTSENEMHCIDPATPFLKNALQKQIKSFLQPDGKGTGGGGYPKEPTESGEKFYANFHIDSTQQDQVNKRRRNKLPISGAQKDNVTP